MPRQWKRKTDRGVPCQCFIKSPDYITVARKATDRQPLSIWGHLAVKRQRNCGQNVHYMQFLDPPGLHSGFTTLI